MSEPRVVLLIVALLLAMAFACTLGARLRLGALLLGLISLIWLLVDTQFEGRTLIVVTSHNGLTIGDLVGVAGIVIAAFQLYRLRPGRRTPGQP